MGLTVVDITLPKSTVAKECLHVIGVDIEEDNNIFTPMIYRLTHAHLRVIDILVVDIALNCG